MSDAIEINRLQFRDDGVAYFSVVNWRELPEGRFVIIPKDEYDKMKAEAKLLLTQIEKESEVTDE